MNTGHIEQEVVIILEGPDERRIINPTSDEVSDAVSLLRRGPVRVLTLSKGENDSVQFTAGARPGIDVSYQQGLICKRTNRPISKGRAEKIADAYTSGDLKWKMLARWRHDDYALSEMLDSIEEEQPDFYLDLSTAKSKGKILLSLLITYLFFFGAGFIERHGSTIGEMLFLDEPSLQELVLYNLIQAAVLTAGFALWIVHLEAPDQ
ncbi:MAG: hypothetical protein AAGJ10_00005 [Bacteroidota bacterium]